GGGGGGGAPGVRAAGGGGGAAPGGAAGGGGERAGRRGRGGGGAGRGRRAGGGGGGGRVGRGGEGGRCGGGGRGAAGVVWGGVGADGYFGGCDAVGAVAATAEAALAGVLNYFAGHQGRLKYALRLRRGQSIGSGLAEGSIKQLVNLRLKRTGARWRVAGVG